MASSEPHFFDIRLVGTPSVVLSLKLAQSLPPMGFMVYLFWNFTPFEAKFEFFMCRSIEEIRFETNTVFVQGKGMTEGLNMRIKSGEWQPFGDHPNRPDCVPDLTL